MDTRLKLEELGKRILSASRTELLLSMRFMGVALDSLRYQMDLSTRSIGTDADAIRFNPNWLAEEYLSHPYMVNRAYLHMILHCLFRHMFGVEEHKDGELWDLSCDIAAESLIDTMHYPAIVRVPSDFREEWYARLQAEVKVLTAEKIYQYFRSQKYDYDMQLRLENEFRVDDHSFWQRMQQETSDSSDDVRDVPQESLEEANGHSPDAQPGPDRQSGEDRSGQNDGAEKNAGNSPQGHPSAGSDERSDAFFVRTNPNEDDWRKKAERIRSDLETFAKEASEDAGSLDRVLSVVSRKKRDYRDFLKMFSVVREEASVDPDSFDYGFYNYGMELYGNMPLIEENEFREARKIDELVIAIDTSASCQDVLVQRFLDETSAVLSSRENFFHHVQIRLIECDDQIQNDICITDLKQMEKYAQHFHMKGGYGTDFRPVFQYVKQIRDNGGLKNLRGLMYFTDGFGIYPKHPTDYATAFVFCGDDDMNDHDVPDWAMKLYLDVTHPG